MQNVCPPQSTSDCRPCQVLAKQISLCDKVTFIHVVYTRTVKKGEPSCSNDTTKNANASKGLRPLNPHQGPLSGPLDPIPLFCLSDQLEERGYAPGSIAWLDWLVGLVD